MPDTHDADECEVGRTISGDLDGNAGVEWLVEVRLRYGTRRHTSWTLLRSDGDRFATIRQLEDAEGFSPRDGNALSIRERRIVGSGAWDCADCGCTEGNASIELVTNGNETELRIDRAQTQITSEPPVCDSP